MWGKFSKGGDGGAVWFMSVGYVGLMRVVRGDGSSYEEYLCEAGSQSSHDRGEFDTRQNRESLLSRGNCALFDSPEDVKGAFVKWRRRSPGAELVKIEKVAYTESAAFEDA